MLLNVAHACLAIGMDRAGFATPGKRAVMHQQVGNHAIYMMSPPDGKDIITLNRHFADVHFEYQGIVD